MVDFTLEQAHILTLECLLMAIYFHVGRHHWKGGKNIIHKQILITYTGFII